jgi:endoglucanase
MSFLQEKRMHKGLVAAIIVAFIVGIMPCELQVSVAQTKPPQYYWWNQPYAGPPPEDPTARVLPLVTVRGTRFVDANGDTVTFRGIAISDPDKLETQGHWNKAHFVHAKEMGANIVRIPIHPVAWRERTAGKYLKLLDQAVAWCTELGLYVMIDWHSIGNLKMGLFQDPYYNTTEQETYEFWRTIARHFKGHHTPAFYELFNEPTIFNGQLGRMSWSEWKKINENMIHLIRAYDADKVILVAGLDWAYDLTPLHDDPIDAEGIGYVSHPYPHKRTKPYEPKWEENFGFAAGRYPVVVTEFGFTLGRGDDADNREYGTAIINYMEAKGISWVAWIFDPDWYPRLLKSWDTYELTEAGTFFKQAMQTRQPARRK